MEETSLLLWCGIAAVMFAAFCFTAWRKLHAMRRRDCKLIFDADDTVDVAPDFVEVVDDELDI